MYQKTSAQITGFIFYLFVLLYSLSVCLYGHPQLYVGFFTDQLSVSSIYLSITSPEHLHVSKDCRANHRLHFLSFCFVIFIVRMSVRSHPQLYVGFFTDQLSVSSIYLSITSPEHLHVSKDCRANHRLHFLSFCFVIFIVFVCLHGHPQLYVGFLTDQLSVSSIYLSITSPEHLHVSKDFRANHRLHFLSFCFVHIHCGSQ